MNTLERELLVDKLNSNIKRQNYLKILSIAALCVDLTTYIILEVIDLAFSKFERNYLILVCFLSKIILFLIVAVSIFFSIFYHKRRLLLASALVYLFLGLGLFSYLIVQEMEADVDGTSMKLITDSKPKVYYTVFLKIIICLNIIAGVFRLLGTIFIFIYLKISNKIIKITIKLNENLLNNHHQCTHESEASDKCYTLLSKNKTYHSFMESQNKLKFTPNERSKCSTFIERGTAFGYGLNSAKNLSTTNSTVDEKDKNSNRSIQQDVNIYIQNNNNEKNSDTTNINVNNIHVHVYNYNTNHNAGNIYKIPPISANTFESADNDKDKEEQFESFYETPKKQSYL